MDLETDPRNAEHLRRLTEACRKALQTLLEEENSREDPQVAEEGHWASRQFSEFNLWCVKAGINHQGLRSIDIRLKDVRGTFDIISQLLQSLKRDINELSQPQNAETDAAVAKAPGRPHSSHNSDDSFSSYDSLSSLEQSQDGTPADGTAPSKRQILQRHIEDTLDRLHGHALYIDRACFSHCRERVKLYQQKDGPGQAYRAYETIARREAKDQFPMAEDKLHSRIAASFARRRIRFDYLKEDQEKRAVESSRIEHSFPHQIRRVTSRNEDLSPKPISSKSISSKTQNTPTIVHSSSRFGSEDHTVHSATIKTKLEPHRESNFSQWAESVLSTLTRHDKFPPAPQVTGTSFQCPYCHLVFRASEARREQWIYHILQDFEPYFCLAKDCEDPFDVPNTFNGLLGHMQMHVEERFHVDMPTGEHKEFTEQEFNTYLTQWAEIAPENLQTLKESARRKGIFLFEECPFCGCYPDDIERSCRDLSPPEAQTRLRQHIEIHLQEIALFLPPYRGDTFPGDVDQGGEDSNVSRGAASLINVELSEENVTICCEPDCDCKDLTKNSKYLLDTMSRTQPLAEAEVSNQNEQHTDLWESIFPESPRYSRSELTAKDCLDDQHLKHFLAAKSHSQMKTSLGGVDATDKSLIAETFPQFSSGIDHRQLQRAYFDLHQPGTCRWLLESPQFLSWISTKGRTLFCSGFPGTGKSVLASMVIHNITQRFQNPSERRVGAAFIYCNYQPLSAENVRHLLWDIAEQLSQTKAFPSQSAVIEGVQLSLSKIMAAYSRVFIIVDAVGRMIEDSADPSLLHELASLQLRHKVNIFVTSRTIPHGLRKDSSVDQIAFRADVEDIWAVLEHRLRLRHAADFLPMARMLAWKANGMFLFARAVLDEIEYSKGDTKIILENMIVEDHNQQLRIPKIDQLYGSVLSQIKEDSAWWRLTTRILSWVTFSKRLLSADELCAILSVRDNPVLLISMDRIISLSYGLLTASPDGSTLGHCHSSFKEYLERNRTRWSLLSETALASDCVHYLSSVVSGRCPTWEDYSARVDRFPFYRYAALNWAYHSTEHLAASPSDFPTMELLRNQALCESSGQAFLLSRFPDYHQAGAGVTGLHLAAIFGLVHEANILLEDTDQNDRDLNGTTPLAYAVGLGNLRMCEIMLENRADPNAADRWGMTPLHIASYFGRVLEAKVLLDHGANIEARRGSLGVDPEVNTNAIWPPLIAHSRQGRTSTASVLPGKHTDAQSTPFDGLTPLMLAASQGHLSIVGALLDRGADVNKKDNRTGYSALHYAIDAKHLETVAMLLERNADKEQKGVNDYPPMLLAVSLNDVNMTKLLLNAGADIEATANGWTAVLLATYAGNQSMVVLLLNKGAAVDSKLDTGWTPLLLAIHKGNHNIALLLLDGGASSNSRLFDGKTPLFIAAGEVGNGLILASLLQRGAEPNVKDENGNTALLTRIDHSNETEGGLNVLLNFGANIEAVGKDGWTPLLFAAATGKEGAVRELLAHGASCDAVGPSGETAMELGAQSGSARICGLLSNKRPYKILDSLNSKRKLRKMGILE